MIDKLFTPLTSQIFGGVLLAGVAYHIYDEIGDARALNAMTADRNQAVANYNTAKANSDTLDGALKQCNASARDAAAVAEQVAAAGVAAVQQVKNAGRATLEDTLGRIEGAPAETCEDAEAILRGESG